MQNPRYTSCAPVSRNLDLVKENEHAMDQE